MSRGFLGLLRGVSFTVLLLPSLPTGWGKEAPISERISLSLTACDASARAKRGEVSIIEIEAIPNYGNQIRFEIVTPPAHGSIEGIRLIDDHSAEVAYHHDGSSSPVTDSFRFRVRSVGRSPSVPAICHLQILAPPPRLSVTPSKIDLGERLIGSVTSTNLLLSNIGGGEIVGKLILPAGVKAPEGESFRLAEGEARSVRLEIAPTVEGHMESLVGFDSLAAGQPVTITATGSPRFELREKGATAWEVINRSGDNLRLEYTGGEGWIAPREMILAPHESKRFFVTPSAEQEAVSLRSPLKISDGYSSKSLTLPKPPRLVPMVVRLTSKEDLGSLTIGGEREILLQVQNRSEFSKSISWSVRCDHGGGSLEPQILDLKPGEIRNLSYLWRPSLPGDALVNISFRESGARDEMKVRCMAHVLVSLTGEVNAPASESSSTGPVTPSPKNSFAAPIEPPKLIPAPEDFSWSLRRNWRGEESLIVTWKSDPGISLTRLCQLVVSRDSQEGPTNNAGLPSIRSEWRDLEGFHPEQKSGSCRALVYGLTPGWYVLSLRTYGPDHNVPAAMTQFTCRVQAPTPWSHLLIRGVEFLALGLMIWWWVKRRG